MSKKNIALFSVSLLLLLTIAFSIAFKSNDSDNDTEVTSNNTSTSSTESRTARNYSTETTNNDDSEDDIEFNAEGVEDHEQSEDYVIETSNVTNISLSDYSGSSLIIDSSGVYNLSGTLKDGQIVIDSEDKETVKIVLNGVNITNSDSSAIYVKNADKVVLVVASGTDNYISDGTSYDFDDEEDEPNAAIFSKSDLTIYSEDGTGSLTVNGNYNDGISSKDGLIVKDVTLNVEAVDDGIRGKDYLIVSGADIEVSCDGDGLKSDNEEDSALGYITINNSDLDITSGGDGITAYTGVVVSGGQIDIVSGEGDGGSFSEDNSMKGIKAGASIVINSGNIDISSSDDGIHSNGDVVIEGGTINISSGDDGIHGDSSIEINGGDINISKSYEGIESAVITINDGDIYIVASDDGLNVAGGNDSSSMGRPGQGGFDAVEAGSYLYINGGYVYMNAGGDGLDSNGSFVMTGGTAIVDGPTNNGNGPLDYNGTFDISGGYLIAVGSSGMAQAPSTTSTQYSVLVNFDSTQSAGTLVSLKDSSGNTVVTYSPAKTYQSICFSSADLEAGETYTVYLGGSSTGEDVNGLYENGTYTAGTEYTTLTIESSVTKVGSSASMGGGGRQPGMR